jgi:hypothetical protein
MLMLDVDHLAGDAGCLRCVGDGDENFLACSRMRVLYWDRRVFQHLRVGREHKYGRIANMADPFRNGFDLIEFSGSGYDAVSRL